MITLFYGGDVNIGRTMNYLSRKLEPFVGIEEMAAADCRLVNLECVIATKGEQTARINTFYLRARPEQTNLLVNADIDVVLTANNHAGDYGKDALLEQSDYLDAAGILHAGSGKNFSEAFAPVYKKVGDVTLAIFSIDSTRKSTAATADTSGTAYLPANNLALWKKVLADRIREAHQKAHVVIVAPHWGVNSVQKPSEQLKKIGHMLIDLGADAILGTHAHHFMGVENYKARPIIYDAGDFLFDSKKRGVGCFTLDISTDGVEKIRFVPLVKRPGQTERAKTSAPEIQKMFVERCAEFNTPIKTLARGVVEISFEPPPRFKIIDSVDTAQIKRLTAPISEPRPEWLVDKVPQDAIISPKDFGGLKLVGYRVPPECRIMNKVQMLYVETYWTIDEPTDKNYLLSIRGVSVRECDMTPYGAGQAHEFLDNMYPTDRWKAGVIYREKFALLAPIPKVRDKMANIDLQISIRVLDDAKVIGEFKDPDLIKMRIEKFPIYNSNFDDVIYRSEAGKCWTAEQLAKVTGGEWIVAPPEGWHVQTISRNDNNVSAIQPRPTFFAAVTSVTDDHYNRIRRRLNQLDGAIVTHENKNLPPDFPQLKVENPVRATVELGFAARKRFQGKVIAVTGSSGKTTTCNMLSQVLGKDNQITATPGTTNTYLEVAWVFASVKQNDAFAIIEMALGSLNRPRGSITYDIMPHVAVVTSIAPAHVANVGTLEEVARYKSRIFCGMTAGSYAILNRDMTLYEVFEQKAKSLKLNVITFGKHSDATIRMPVIADGEEFSVAGKTYKLSCPVPAEQIYDALAVVGVSLAVGFPIEKTLEYLKTFTPVKGRGNVLKI
ncbi:MAG: CapA family protein, partial [Selenomonadaceae bacterium]|nr:CapA family protein [Selenomonadaceae bacterium]